MSTRYARERLTTIEQVLEALGGDPDKIGKDITWCGVSYSLRDLILDLREVQKAQQQPK